jgi:hypothetical protein
MIKSMVRPGPRGLHVDSRKLEMNRRAYYIFVLHRVSQKERPGDPLR